CARNWDLYYFDYW
nr:immunoglobulin heavy chain junction region [Mus musculus]